MHTKFKYISCYCLSIRQLKNNTFFYIQIHLMLLFIKLKKVSYKTNNYIQIHLMLLFIKQCFLPGFLQTCIQIHLMLLFISCLSSMMSGLINSNTSHVIVYPALLKNAQYYSSKFKYISCYCLSIKFCIISQTKT